MAIIFMRITKLRSGSGGLRGRAEYISSSKKQENIVMTSPHVDWSIYSGGNIEGREFVITLPNEWFYDFKTDLISKTELQKRINMIRDITLSTNKTNLTGKYPESQYALHFNHKGDIKNKKTGEKYQSDNFHMHLIFSERIIIGGIKYYTKDVYLTCDGKVAVRSEDRALDNNGNVLPPIHKKGSIKSNVTLSTKDREYDTFDFAEKRKHDLRNYFIGLGVELDDEEYFPQYHYGKGSESELIKQKSKKIQEIGRKAKSEYIVPSKYDDNGKKTAEYKAFLKDVRAYVNNPEDNDLSYIMKKHTKKKEPEKDIKTKPVITSAHVDSLSANTKLNELFAEEKAMIDRIIEKNKMNNQSYNTDDTDQKHAVKDKFLLDLWEKMGLKPSSPKEEIKSSNLSAPPASAPRTNPETNAEKTNEKPCLAVPPKIYFIPKSEPEPNKSDITKGLEEEAIKAVEEMRLKKSRFESNKTEFAISPTTRGKQNNEPQLGG